MIPFEHKLQEVKALWVAHRALPFPPGLRGKEINGIDIVLLDGGVAGCVFNFIKDDTLGVWHTAILGLEYHALGLLVRDADLSANARQYFLRLETIVRLILEYLRGSQHPQHLQELE